jgi:hypothetical protein
MKNLKIVGLATVAALALIAIAGVGSASATRLCAENATPCPEAKRYVLAQAFNSTLETGNVVFNAGLYNVECTGSTINGSIENQGGAGNVIIDLETITFAGCGCPVTAVKTGSMSVEHTTGTMNGKLTTANIELTWNCMGHCIYGEGSFGTLTGGAMGTMDVNGTMNRVKGSPPGCPATVTWKGSYTVTTPEPLYVSEA